MYITRLEVESHCGLAKTSSLIDRPLIIPYAYPLSIDRNYVFCFTEKDALNPVHSDVLNDFISYKIVNSGNYTVIDGVKRSHRIISSISSNGGVPLFPIVITEGAESVGFLTYSADDFERIILGISKKNVIVNQKTKKISIDEVVQEIKGNIVSSFPVNLSKTEADIIQKAFANGFYSWPRKCSLEKLSSTFGLSKPTVSYHLRNGERKLIEYVLGNSES
ncbi:helix-turn-helix domain-containing protein [Thermoplasmatales archaeon AK]|nr:helix-turn-helix domain-containing protein [Thermoplasmatales archaeon AK]